VEAGQFLAAKFVDLPRGVKYEILVGAGCDEYVYVFEGNVSASFSGTSHDLEAGFFLPLHEGATATFIGSAPESRLYIVTAKGNDLPGIPAADTAVKVQDLPIVDVPAQLKQRIYLVGKESIPSERSHGMIVNYTGDTWTKSHHHPNAESVFFFLKGNGLALANGTEHPMRAGDFIYFAVNDSHGLRSADDQGLSFLEFHAPSKFVTIYDSESTQK
jgi:quercetin dioxygenase-like cupin family protein